MICGVVSLVTLHDADIYFCFQKNTLCVFFTKGIPNCFTQSIKLVLNIFCVNKVTLEKTTSNLKCLWGFANNKLLGNMCHLQGCRIVTGVVYFDQRLGSAHSKCCQNLFFGFFNVIVRF